VWPFAIPATGSAPVTFGIATRLGTRVLGALDDRDVARALAAAALRNRVTPHGLSFDAPEGRCTASQCALDWRAYDEEMAPVLDGTLVPGVRGTFADVRVPAAVWASADADVTAYLAAWRRHFEERGWADRLWLFTIDEPKPDQLAELARRARLAQKAGVRVFVTAKPAPEIAALVDAFAPNVTFFTKGARPFLSQKPGAAAARPFWYASCLSHGCGELPERGPAREAMVQEFRGWPGYEIDRPSAAVRALAWLGWREGVRGELYYDMIYGWRGDPWRDPRAFAGNGDGTLLYPGRTEAWGGKRPFPVESIRLRVVRDAQEDVELLRLAEARGLGELARRVAADVAPGLREFSRDPAAWLHARRRLAEALTAAQASR
jgi:hypothetical protein